MHRYYWSPRGSRHEIPIYRAVGDRPSALVVGIALGAQDRWALKAPNGISFAELKGYDAWDMVASSLADDASGCGTSKAPGCIKSIVGNPVLIKAYGEGIPANGKPVPDGAAFAKIEWTKARDTHAPYGAFVPGPLAEVSFMLKDRSSCSPVTGAIRS